MCTLCDQSWRYNTIDRFSYSRQIRFHIIQLKCNFCRKTQQMLANNYFLVLSYKMCDVAIVIHGCDVIHPSWQDGMIYSLCIVEAEPIFAMICKARKYLCAGQHFWAHIHVSQSTFLQLRSLTPLRNIAHINPILPKDHLHTFLHHGLQITLSSNVFH